MTPTHKYSWKPPLQQLAFPSYNVKDPIGVLGICTKLVVNTDRTWRYLQSPLSRTRQNILDRCRHSPGLCRGGGDNPSECF
jgi:hypothetical protein